MSALYAMIYAGSPASGGLGTIYIGKGIILGMDAGNGRYRGTYREEGGRMKVNVTITFPTGGTLVTGAIVGRGGALEATADWPLDFANGKPNPILIQGKPVKAVFEKIGDIP